MKGNAKTTKPSRLRAKDIAQIILEATDLDSVQAYLQHYPPKQVVNALIRLFYHGQSPKVRWWAISLFGSTVARVADTDMEDARVIMRRLMWSLNDESGGIGWGAPEAMATAMANHSGLAQEYYNILLSYIWPDGNFLEHDPLRKGALWGVMVLAKAQPEILRNSRAPELLRSYLVEQDPEVKVLAALALSYIGDSERDCTALKTEVASLGPEGEKRIIYYFNGEFIEGTVREQLESAAHRLCKDV